MSRLRAFLTHDAEATVSVANKEVTRLTTGSFIPPPHGFLLSLARSVVPFSLLFMVAGTLERQGLGYSWSRLLDQHPFTIRINSFWW
jgi:hypothetical protein